MYPIAWMNASKPPHRECVIHTAMVNWIRARMIAKKITPAADKSFKDSLSVSLFYLSVILFAAPRLFQE